MITKELENTLSAAVEEAIKRHHEYVTLEHLLFALLNDRMASDVIHHCGGNIDALKKEVEQFFDEHMEKHQKEPAEMPEQTVMFRRVLQYALLQTEASQQKEVNSGNVQGSAEIFHRQLDRACCGWLHRSFNRESCRTSTNDSGAFPPPKKQSGLRRRARSWKDGHRRRSCAEDPFGRGPRSAAVSARICARYGCSACRHKIPRRV